MILPPPPGAATAGPPGPIPHWFFTSYSDDESNFPLVKRFHEDVERAVRLILGKAIPGRGFVDFRDVKPGELWEDRVVETGVCTTRAMLALYSPSFFQSHWCAHEWTVFTARVGRYRANGGGIPCLFGVLWQKGRREWPDAVTAFHFVRRGPDSVYERRGLVHLVPLDPQTPGSQEYRDIVQEVAELIAEAHAAALPPIKVDDTRQLRPPFGPESSLTIDYVMAYAEKDRDWGEWVYAHLAELGEVDVLPPECLGRAPCDLLRISLSRAQRVVVLLSGHSLADKGLNRTILESVYADPELTADLPRLVPLFIESVPDDGVPASLHPGIGNALYGIPDADAARDIVLAAVNAPVPTHAGVREPAPAYPSSAVSPFEGTLVDKLSLASSLRDPYIRRIWFEATGLDPAEEPDFRLQTRVWLLAVVRIARKQTDGYARLALALEAIDSESPESIEVRKLVDSHTPVPKT